MAVIIPRPDFTEVLNESMQIESLRRNCAKLYETTPINHSSYLKRKFRSGRTISSASTKYGTNNKTPSRSTLKISVELSNILAITSSHSPYYK